MLTAGIDCGAKNTKTVILHDSRIIGKGSVLTGFDQHESMKDSFNKAINMANIRPDDINNICGTGAGKEAVTIAHFTTNDIKAISKGASYLFPKAGTVIDIGAEDGKAANFDDQGNPIDFAVNGKCAAGAGAFIEAMARALEIPLEEIGRLALKSSKNIPMNTQCVIFAESEVIGLIHAKTERQDICKAIHDAMATRTAVMVRRIDLLKEIVFFGGLAYNPGFIQAIKQELKLDKINIPEDPDYGAALGAAIIAAEG